MSVVTAVLPQRASADDDAFASAAECIRRHPNITRMRLYHAATVGRVAVRLLPGLPPRYSLADVAKVSEQLAGG